MPSKGRKGASAKVHKGTEDQREEAFPAIVFADSFEPRFSPFTLEQPRCLLPLANTPLIEYTLEFLAGAGVDEVYLYCGNRPEAVEHYLRQSKWTLSASPFSLEIIRTDARSVGDCMRDMHAKQLIVGDFLCVYGDVVANLSLESALTAHRARREKDKKCIMTMVLREAGEHHRTRSHHARPAFFIDTDTSQCVHYEQIHPGHTATLDIPGELLRDHTEVEMREDVIDCGIDICTPEVLAQYVDNFDWLWPRAGFLKGVLKDFETFQLMIFTHVATGGYAARVHNWHTYDAVSKDALSRWTYPLTPDANLVADQSFQLYKGNVYREDGVVLSRLSVVNRQVALGRATSVGDDSVITNSVIGRRCVIGKRVKIDGAYIWDDVSIGDDTIIETAIIGAEASIGKQCRVERGALVSYRVKIADGTTVPRDRRISTLQQKQGHEQDELVHVETDTTIVGEGGLGHHVEFDEEEEDVDEVRLRGVRHRDHLAIDEISILDSDEEVEEEREFHTTRSNSGRSDSFASMDSDASGETRKQARDFHKEAVNSLYDDLQHGADADTMQLEFKPLVFSANAQDHQIRRAFAVAFNRHIASLIEGGASPKEAVAAVIPRYSSLIEAYLREEEWQAEYLLFAQIDLARRAYGEKILLFLSNALATNDLVEAEGFERWWNDVKSSASSELEAVRRDTKQLVDVLCGDDEDDDDDEEESEEESGGEQ